jgi:hypothetical protein
MAGCWGSTLASLYTEGGAVELDRRPRVGIAAEDLEPQLLKWYAL